MSTEPSKPDLTEKLSEFGWIVEPTSAGGVRLRTCGVLRWVVLAVSCGVLLLIGLFACFMGAIVARLDRVPDETVYGYFPTLVLLVLIGSVALPAMALLLHIFWLLSAREQWEAGDNRLEVQRRLLGLRWGHAFVDGKLLVEPQFTNRKEAFWRLAVKSHGQKKYLIHERSLSERGTGIGFSSPRNEVEALAKLLAQHTGWPFVTEQQEAEAAVHLAMEYHELPRALQDRGFRLTVDERLRPTIVRPKLAQVGCGSVALLIGGIWLSTIFYAVHSFVEHSGGAQEALKDWSFWLIATPMLLAGMVVVLLGIIIIVSRERWIVDRNLLLVRFRLSGWKSEVQFVDAIITLAHVGNTVDERTLWTWEVQLQDRTGQVLKVLYKEREDNAPRQLASLLSQHTGWRFVDTLSD